MHIEGSCGSFINKLNLTLNLYTRTFGAVTNDAIRLNTELEGAQISSEDHWAEPVFQRSPKAVSAGSKTRRKGIGQDIKVSV